MKLVTSAEMRLLEERAVAAGISLDDLMRRAGAAVAGDIVRVFDPVAGRKILVLAGPGNNGGDGLVAAVHLRQAGASVAVFLPAGHSPEDPVLKSALAGGLDIISFEDDPQLDVFDRLLLESDLIVDALFGTGSLRPISGLTANVLDRVAATRRDNPELAVVAIDLPSGVNADTGDVDPHAIPADLTVSLSHPKRGQFLFPGADYTGSVSIVDIGIPEDADIALDTGLLTDAGIRQILPQRPDDASKGTFGRVMVLAGPAEYAGAPVLTCLAAYRAGAGLVTLSARRSLYPVFAAKLTEVTYLLFPETGDDPAEDAPGYIIPRLDECASLVIGPGLGRTAGTARLMARLLESLPAGLSLVLDADALNILAGQAEWWRRLDRVGVLTPHPKEMSRLTGLTVADIQADRIETARRHAIQWQQVVVLKGAHTVIASAQGEVMVSPFANPGLATAGTGDVLAGIIGALTAQGLSPFDAATAGVYLHALAGERVREELGDSGYLASDLLINIPKAVKTIKETGHASGDRYR
ncbi:carbohydrate kinase, YjeF related protein [Dehalogenimonas lykanthroporepellens BL-DC-9]|jgi:NAD(P)H-hydrate epimerase|nr:carbohydrate kinase, YjeF related protein [Dehalogenimonas lykanthroporepellens BL-DC-9]